jgi:hypothetical protein
MLIGGEWVEASGATLPVIDPASGEAFCRVPAGDAADIDRAVAAARRPSKRRMAAPPPGGPGAPAARWPTCSKPTPRNSPSWKPSTTASR